MIRILPIILTESLKSLPIFPSQGGLGADEIQPGRYLGALGQLGERIITDLRVLLAVGFHTAITGFGDGSGLDFGLGGILAGLADEPGKLILQIAQLGSQIVY